MAQEAVVATCGRDVSPACLKRLVKDSRSGETQVIAPVFVGRRQT